LADQNQLRLVIAADHAGFPLKEHLKSYLKHNGYSVVDLGTHSEQLVDYPDLALALARSVASGEYDRGIMVCGTGIGGQIVANKVPGVRAGVCHDTYSARVSRAHNDLNVLCLGGRVIGPELALDIVATWLATDFSREERHLRRVAKIADIEHTRGDCPQRRRGRVS